MEKQEIKTALAEVQEAALRAAAALQRIIDRIEKERENDRSE